MNAPQHPLNNLKLSGNLPSMPQVLVQLIDACHAQNVDLQKVADLVCKDTAISAKILQLVNSAFIGTRRKFTDTRQAVVFLGADVVKNLAISVSVQQVFRRVETNGLLSMDRFWHHSFKNALIAQNIAKHINYLAPSDAYLSGLMHDIGKILLWMAFPGKYAPLLLKGIRCHNARLTFLEKEKLDIDHCEAGGWLCDQWLLPSVLADAIRYHHHPVEEVEQALPLTRIIALADLISHNEGAPDQETLEAADRFFNLNKRDLQSITKGIDTQIQKIAEDFNIRIPKASKSSLEADEASEEIHKEVSVGLINRIRDITQLTGVLENLLKGESSEKIILTVEQSLKILFNESSCLFLLWADREKTELQGYTSDTNHLAGSVNHFRFKFKEDGKSLLERAIRKQKMVHSFSGTDDTTQRISLLDQQLLHLIETEGFMALPLVYRDEIEGLLVIGLKGDQLTAIMNNATPLHLLAHHTAISLYLERFHQREAEKLLNEKIAAASLVARKVAHEINNPVAILRNYVQILGIKNRDGEDIGSELKIIDEELERVGNLTEQLRDLAGGSTTLNREEIQLNQLLKSILSFYIQSVSDHPCPQIKFQPGRDLPNVMADKDAIRQIMLNLLNNAVEALSSDNTIEIKTGLAGDEVEILVRDDGPGIPEEKQEEIFTPGMTTKHNGHSGLGLAIIKKLLADIGGTVSCKSNATGTTFSVLLPKSNS